MIWAAGIIAAGLILQPLAAFVFQLTIQRIVAGRMAKNAARVQTPSAASTQPHTVTMAMAGGKPVHRRQP